MFTAWRKRRKITSGAASPRHVEGGRASDRTSVLKQVLSCGRQVWPQAIVSLHVDSVHHNPGPTWRRVKDTHTHRFRGAVQGTSCLIDGAEMAILTVRPVPSPTLSRCTHSLPVAVNENTGKHRSLYYIVSKIHAHKAMEKESRRIKIQANQGKNPNHYHKSCHLPHQKRSPNRVVNPPPYTPRVKHISQARRLPSLGSTRPS